MPNKNPRIQVTFSEDTNAMIALLAEKKGISRSAVTSNLVETALDLEEDLLYIHCKTRHNYSGMRFLTCVRNDKKIKQRA